VDRGVYVISRSTEVLVNFCYGIPLWVYYGRKSFSFRRFWSKFYFQKSTYFISLYYY